MLNPDGCFLGNYRTDAGGVDLNRTWTQPSHVLEPSIYHTLQMLRRYHEDPAFSLGVFIDIHAHSTSKTSFMYCNPVPQSRPDCQAFVDKLTRLPRLLQARMQNMCFSPLRWDADPSKAGCARRVAGALFPNTACYTLEISFFSCLESAEAGKEARPTNGAGPVESPGGRHSGTRAGKGPPSPGRDAGSGPAFANTVEGYKEMGRRLALAFFDYYGLDAKRCRRG
eukprot:evm.model.scf_780.3 EVM.evm.TU.scf_780.3   scf_780:7944-10684(+)